MLPQNLITEAFERLGLKTDDYFYKLKPDEFIRYMEYAFAVGYETRMAEVNKRYNVKKRMPVMCINEFGNASKPFESFREAARSIGCNKDGIRYAIDHGTEYYGYKWKLCTA